MEDGGNEEFARKSDGDFKEHIEHAKRMLEERWGLFFGPRDAFGEREGGKEGGGFGHASMTACMGGYGDGA